MFTFSQFYIKYIVQKIVYIYIYNLPVRMLELLHCSLRNNCVEEEKMIQENQTVHTYRQTKIESKVQKE